MMKKYSLTLIFFSVFIINFISMDAVWSDEPTIGTYTSYPIFQTSSVEPNILILLDTSSSMNWAAYSDSYMGTPYNNGASEISVSIKESSDDATEKSDGSFLTNGGLYLGYYDGDSYMAGMRFQDLSIPAGATITNAYITFTSYDTLSASTSLEIVGEDVDSAETFSAASTISGRTDWTDSSVSWEPGNWSQPTTSGGGRRGGGPGGGPTTYHTYDTPDLTEIVQEIVDRDGWASGQDMVFKITYTGTSTSNAYRRPYSYDDSSSHAAELVVTYIITGDANAETYYGYFNPDYFYTYNSSNNWFEHAYYKDYYDSVNGYWVVTDLSGNSLILSDDMKIDGTQYYLWDGNWMNWASMRRYDVLKKVLIGGKSATTTITEDGEDVTYTYIIGEVTTNSFSKTLDASAGPAVTPAGCASKTYTIKDGKIYIDTTSYWLHIKKDINYEPTDFDSSGNLAGILQKIGNRARWGNEFFNQSYQGGKVINAIGSDISTIVEDISDEGTKVGTPLAESLYTAMRYFMQENTEVSGYESDCTCYVSSGGVKGTVYDPYYYYDETEAAYKDMPCVNSYVLLLTDGAPSWDTTIPSYLEDYDGDGDDGSSNDLDDIAYYMHINDLRDDIDDMNNITLYAVLAFDNNEEAVDLLIEAAINGGFDDKDGDKYPDSNEYVLDANGYPENFYKASDGYLLERELLSAINDILKRAASGTAVSVLATSSEGEGNLIQAFFKPVVPSDLQEIKWGGFIQSLWVDAKGNLREDTDKDHALDVTEDNIIRYFTDEDTGDTKVKLWDVDDDTPYPDITEEDPDVEMDIEDIIPIWEGAKQLSERSPGDRDVFTYLDMDDDDVVDESTDNPFDASGELVAFSADSLSYDASSLIGPYLGISDDTTWAYLGNEYDDRVDNLINYIRGTDITGFRSRTLDSKVWKLGDIIHSTPVSVSKPADNYHLIYGDESYGTHYKNNLSRETVIYVGANDGMLHAFTSGVYNSATKGFTEPTGDVTYGDELWAYIPQALLPHLKWLADPDYTHVYYCDMKPKVFDAKIDGTWHTLLLLGLNLGGKTITATGDFDYDDSNDDTTRTFASSYTLLDITDPRDPGVLWERSYDDLELTTSFPAVIKVKEKWFAVFGSGPSDYDGTTAKNGHVFIVDLSTGDPYKSTVDSVEYDWLFETVEANAFMNSPVSVDVGLNYNVDAIYLGDAYYDSSETVPWMGKIYKVVVPWVDSGGNYDGDNSTPDTANYSDNPLDTGTNKAWQFVPILDAERPITASVALSMDTFDNVWVYVGTGRYLSSSDKTNTDKQYMFGVKDPFYNEMQSDYYHDYSPSTTPAYKELKTSDLLNSDPYLILDDGNIYLDSDNDGILDSGEYTTSYYYGNWSDLLTDARGEDGWTRSLTISGERIITKFTILGGIVFTPSFVPDADICGYSGDSYLYGQYYETGTAYWGAGLSTYELDGITQMMDKTSLGSGLASNVGVHVDVWSWDDDEDGDNDAKGFIQTSSGNILEINLDTAFNVKSGLRSWREKQ